MKNIINARRGLGAALLVGSIATSTGATAAPFTDEFPIENCSFTHTGANPYFRLAPGRQAYFSNQRCVSAGDCDELEEVWITVTNRTRAIQLSDDGVTRTIVTRVVQEFETVDGEVAEVSRNYFAICQPSRDVYYFGEEVDNYEDGRIVDHEGAWLAGRRGAEPGIIMPDAAFLLGSRYFQELAPGVALDRAEHVGNDIEIDVPFGFLEDCVRVRETTPLEPGSVSTKIYCPGTGLVRDDELELISIIHNASPPTPDD
jgi:hypothetical protein